MLEYSTTDVLFLSFFSIEYSFENCTNKASYFDLSISTVPPFNGILTSPSIITTGEEVCTSAIFMDELSETMTVVFFSNEAIGVIDNISGSPNMMGPWAENVYPVLRVGVEIIIPSALSFQIWLPSTFNEYLIKEALLAGKRPISFRAGYFWLSLNFATILDFFWMPYFFFSIKPICCWKEE